MPIPQAPRPPHRGFAVEVGTRLREVRQHRGYQQREIASRANVGQDMLSKYEAGVNVPSLKRAWALARGLAVPVDLFLPVFDFPEAVDRELYQRFRKIWFESLAVRAFVLQTLKLALEVLKDTAVEEHHAPRR